MIGAIIGDIVGSRFEWKNYKAKDFELLTKESKFTDDTVMTVAVADALMQNKQYDIGEIAQKCMLYWGNKYPDVGYGGMFRFWLKSKNPEPYGSFGNGAAMRVSPCGIVAMTSDEARTLACEVTSITHNHAYSYKAAQAVAYTVWAVRRGYPKYRIYGNITDRFYHIYFTLDDIRDTYKFNSTCQGSVPQVLEAFFESENFIDAIRNAVSIGGDSDTIACITGSIAWEYYRAHNQLVDNDYLLWDECYKRLPIDMQFIVDKFCEIYEPDVVKIMSGINERKGE